MKCQNCGKNEVNFYYSSNVNGSVTEAHLCSECAAESGYGLEHMFGVGSSSSNFFPFSFSRRFMPIPVFGLGFAPAQAPWPQTGLPQKEECVCDGVCEAPVKENPTAEVDGDMQKRREINIIREQMRLAAEKEDYEQAMKLRDQIREMEDGL